jgi:riboflavin kinase / FMN adenylyltransferase
MRLFRHETDITPDARGAVLTLGNFDGVHLGHQAVIAEALKIARAEGRQLGVLTFEPHTRAFFNPDLPPFRLTPLRVKLHALEALGVDFVVALAFDERLAAVTAEDFAEKFLSEALGISRAVAGGNFRYGNKHAGTMETLAAAGEKYGFKVTRVAPVSAADGTVYSATTVRKFIAAGDLRRAAMLLGRPYEIDGRVITGDKRGRELGFPTANLEITDYMRPAYGIYAIRALVDRPGSSTWIDGVANLGIRPMWRTKEPMLEAHLFDFSEDIYGQILRVRLYERLRPEANFDSIQALIDQVELDKVAAREALLASPE